VDGGERDGCLEDTVEGGEGVLGARKEDRGLSFGLSLWLRTLLIKVKRWWWRSLSFGVGCSPGTSAGTTFMTEEVSKSRPRRCCCGWRMGSAGVWGVVELGELCCEDGVALEELWGGWG
jgi:hypothetical protein